MLHIILFVATEVPPHHVCCNCHIWVRWRRRSCAVATKQIFLTIYLIFHCSSIYVLWPPVAPNTSIGKKTFRSPKQHSQLDIVHSIFGYLIFFCSKTVIQLFWTIQYTIIHISMICGERIPNLQWFFYSVWGSVIWQLLCSKPQYKLAMQRYSYIDQHVDLTHAMHVRARCTWMKTTGELPNAHK